MTSEPVRWWEIQDDGSWPGWWHRPPLYLLRTQREPARQHDPSKSDLSLRPHP